MQHTLICVLVLSALASCGEKSGSKDSPQSSSKTDLKETKERLIKQLAEAKDAVEKGYLASAEGACDIVLVSIRELDNSEPELAIQGLEFCGLAVPTKLGDSALATISEKKVGKGSPECTDLETAIKTLTDNNHKTDAQKYVGTFKTACQ